MIHFTSEEIKKYCSMIDRCALLIEVEGEKQEKNLVNEYTISYYSGLA